MGLLDKIDARGGDKDNPGEAETSNAEDIRVVITDFYQEYPSFHSIVLRYAEGREGILDEIEEMMACHGAICKHMSDRTCLVLLPGGLDMELFSHRISKSTGSTVAFQLTADSPSIAFDTLYSHLP